MLLLVVADADADGVLRVQTWFDALDANAVRAPARINVRRAWFGVDTTYVAAGSPSGVGRLYYRPDSTTVFPYSYTGDSGEFLCTIPDSVDGLNIEIRASMGPEARPCTTTVAWALAGLTVDCTLTQYVDIADSGWTAFDPWLSLNESGAGDLYDIERDDLEAVMLAEGLNSVIIRDDSWDDTEFSYDDDPVRDIWNDAGLGVFCQATIQDGAWGYVLPYWTTAKPTVDGALTAHLGPKSPGFAASRWYDRVDSLDGGSILAGIHRKWGIADTTRAHGANEIARDLWWSPLDSTLTEPDLFMLAHGLHRQLLRAGIKLPNHRAYADWRRLQEMGADLNICAGSGARLNRFLGFAPPGAWRTYVAAPPSYHPGYAMGNMAKGYSYISNGLTLTRVTLDGYMVGTSITATRGETLTLSVGVHSAIAADSLYLWVNGTILSAVAFAGGDHDTTYVEDFTIYGETDAYVWVEVVGHDTDIWTDANCGGRYSALTNPWTISIVDRPDCYERRGAVYCDARRDTVASYFTGLDNWPDKHTTKSSADSLAFVAQDGRTNTETERKRVLWVHPSGRTFEDGTQEFPYDDIRESLDMLVIASGDTLYLHPGTHPRVLFPAVIPADDITIAGAPHYSRDAIIIDQAARALAMFTNTAATKYDDITFRRFSITGGTALGDGTALFEMGGPSSNIMFDDIRIADFDCDDSHEDGFLDADDITNLTVRNSEFASNDFGNYGLARVTSCTTVVWSNNRHIESTYHVGYPFFLDNCNGATFTNSLFGDIDVSDDQAPVACIYQPTGRHSFRGCTIYACETHDANDQSAGTIRLVNIECDTQVSIHNCVFAELDSTYAVGFAGTATTIDTLYNTLGYNAASWPPAATDTLGLHETNPHFNRTDFAKLDVLRITSWWGIGVTCSPLAYMGWLLAERPKPTPSLLVDRFGTVSGGGGGGGPGSKTPPATAFPPPGS